MKKYRMKRALLILFIVSSMAGKPQAAEYTKVEGIQFRDGVPACKLDVSYVQGVKDRPVIIWFHGGSLTGGKNNTPKELLTRDYTVASVDYRLYPSVSVKEILDDAALATAWVVKNIRKYGGSADKIYFAGHSAGGYIVSMLALDKSYLGKYGVDPDRFAAIVPFSGQMITHFTERKSRGIPEGQPVIDDMAPLYHVRADTAPFIVITADRNMEMVCRYEENALFCALMKYAGNTSVTLYEEGGFNHSGMVYPGYRILMAEIEKQVNPSNSRPSIP